MNHSIIQAIKYSLLIILLVFASCDKIDEEERLVPAGAKAQWEEGSGVDDKTQRTLLEKYTGVGCINCPIADINIHKADSAMGGRLIAVSIHDFSSTLTSPVDATSPDLRTEVGQVWSSFFGITQLPMALVGRNRKASDWAMYNPADASLVMPSISDALDQPNVAALAVKAVKNGDDIDITVDLEYLQDLTDSLTVTLFIMEDSIRATQKNGHNIDTNYIHNHILRDAITDPWGALVDDGRTSNVVNAGTKRRGSFTYTPSKDWRLDRCHIVAYLSNYASKRIYNAAKCDIE
ncbi:MAG: Omp28-related outer membrane protein [Bacteroidales bacterium]|nr:Omp28-related outer membrane protein [Bacteroidales bacterium]